MVSDWSRIPFAYMPMAAIRNCNVLSKQWLEQTPLPSMRMGYIPNSEMQVVSWLHPGLELMGIEVV